MNCLSYSEAVERFDIADLTLYLRQLPEHLRTELFESVDDDALMQLLNYHPRFELVLHFRNKFGAVSGEFVESLDVIKRVKLAMVCDEFDKALEMLDSLEMVEDESEFLDLRSCCLLNLDRYEEAMVAYERLKELGDMVAYDGLRVCYEELDMEDEALAVVQEGVREGCAVCISAAGHFADLADLDFEDRYDEVYVCEEFLKLDDEVNLRSSLERLWVLSVDSNMARDALVSYYTYLELSEEREVLGNCEYARVLNLCDQLIDAGFYLAYEYKAGMLALRDDVDGAIENWKKGFEAGYIDCGLAYFMNVDSVEAGTSYFSDASSKGLPYAKTLYADCLAGSMNGFNQVPDIADILTDLYKEAADEGDPYGLLRHYLLSEKTRMGYNPEKVFKELRDDGSYIGLAGLWALANINYANNPNDYSILAEIEELWNLLSNPEVGASMFHYNEYSRDLIQMYKVAFDGVIEQILSQSSQAVIT